MPESSNSKFDELPIFTDSREFLEILRLSNPIWSSQPYQWTNPWLFRGHGDGVNWKLIPTAWRENQFDITVILQSFEAKYKKLYKEDISTHISEKLYELDGVDKNRLFEALYHLACEYQLINEFTDFANIAGLRSISRNIKPIKDVLISYISFILNGTVVEFEDFWSDPVYALAQHHGISTRLLDWTRNPLAAAFFAASSETISTEYISVYAVHQNTLRQSHVAVVELPRADDNYFHAQSAVLTVDCTADLFYSVNGFYPDLELTLRNNPILQSRKISLVASEVGNLLRLLWLEGVSKAHLMPTLDNVAQSVHMKLKQAPVPFNKKTST